MGIEVHKPSNLAIAKLCRADFMVILVILKCNSNLFFFINQYFHLFNWHLRVLIVQKEIPDMRPHSKLFSGFRACLVQTILPG